MRKDLNKRTIETHSNIEYGISVEGSQILTNQKRENSAFSILVG